MKSTNRRTRFALLVAVVAALLVVVVIFLRPSGEPGTALAPAAAPAASDPGHARVPSAPGAAPRLATTTERPTRAPVPMPAAMQKVLDDNPHLGQYYRLQQKVLPTEDERAALHAMLSDVELIQSIKEDLTAEEKTYSKDVEAKRMVEVEFLTDAVSWADNTEMAAVSAAIEGVVFADNIAADAPDELAQSQAGDKMELYTQMLHRAPARAALLAEHAKGQKVEPFLAYSKDWYDREMRGMKADELP